MEKIDKEFWSGGVMVTRYDYESLPCPMCAEILSDETMQKIADDTHNLLLSDGWSEADLGKYLGNSLDEFEDENSVGDCVKSDFWRCMEKAALDNGMRYYEDIKEDMFMLKTGTYAINKKNKVDGLKLLADINDGVIATAFFDPQYRGILDKMKYGNEGEARGKARCALPQMDEETIVKFIKEINRVLKDSGHLFLWVDKFHLCQGVLDWFTDTDLNLVDMVVWDKGKIGMGYRTRRKSEYLIVLQKNPVRAKGCWNDHAIPDVWEEKTPKVHPHSKPVELQKRLIAATTREGDYVLDPAAGGYSVFKACKALGRDFIGGDIEYGED